MFERLKKRFLGENLEKPFLQKANVSTTLTDDPNIESELGIQEIYGLFYDIMLLSKFQYV